VCRESFSIKSITFFSRAKKSCDVGVLQKQMISKKWLFFHVMECAFMGVYFNLILYMDLGPRRTARWKINIEIEADRVSVAFSSLRCRWL